MMKEYRKKVIENVTLFAEIRGDDDRANPAGSI